VLAIGPDSKTRQLAGRRRAGESGGIERRGSSGGGGWRWELHAVKSLVCQDLGAGFLL
jgi:hypothetical protein